MLDSKLSYVDVSEQLWKEMMQNVRDGILRKLKVTRDIIDGDKHVAAGLYVYAVEEFGKLLLLKNTTVLGSTRRIAYKDEFVNHKKKFETAFDYFQANGHDACLVISEGDYVVSDFVWRDFAIGLLANTQARLSIFYSDFARDEKNNVIIEKPLPVDKDILQMAINELDKATKSLNIP
jgi:AbiV family abortive infection protein